MHWKPWYTDKLQCSSFIVNIYLATNQAKFILHTIQQNSLVKWQFCKKLVATWWQWQRKKVSFFKNCHQLRRNSHLTSLVLSKWYNYKLPVHVTQNTATFTCRLTRLSWNQWNQLFWVYQLVCLWGIVKYSTAHIKVPYLLVITIFLSSTIIT